MFISDRGSFSVEGAIAATGPLTSTPTSKMASTSADLIQPTGTFEEAEPPQSSPQPPPLETPEFTAGSAAASASGASVSASEDNATTNKNLLPLILAPIMAVFGLAALFVLWRYFYKRRKAKRVAPSAEFKQYQRTSPLADAEGGAAAVGVRGMRSMDDRPASYAYQNNNNGEEAEGGDAPPPFTPGLFKDPIFEKGVAMSLANQSGTWTSRHGHGSSAAPGIDVRTERQDSLPFAGGDDSPASLSLLAHGQGQMERQQLIPPEERYYNAR